MSERPSRARRADGEDFQEALRAAPLERAWEARPSYQGNDDLGWMERVKRPDTRMKRIRQMLDELERGACT